jgi:hypothetical protein
MMLPKTILALRGGQGDSTRLQIEFDRIRDGVAGATLTVWVGSDYFAVIDGDRLTITDLRLLRRFVIDRKASTLVNLSLYGDVMLRRVELVRRMEIAAELIKEKNHPDLPESLDRFWIESELALSVLGIAPMAMETRQNAGATEFLHGGQIVALVKPSETEIPRAVAHAYGAFLRWALPVHPNITRFLGLLGNVPARLDYISEAKGKPEKISLRLRKAETVSADYPMPPRLSLVLLPWGTNDPDVALMREVLPHMTDAMTSRGAANSAGQIASYREAIDRDFKEGHKFAAALRLTELALRWGRSATQCEPSKDSGPCRNKEEIDKFLRGDPRSVTMFKATALQEKKPEKALELWRGLDRHDVPNGYVVDIFTSRLLSEAGERRAAAKAFAAAFAGNPSIIALYRALGDHFARVSRIDLAWLAYDLGRALPNRAPPDALIGIDTIEQQLAETYPEMF